MQVFGSFLSISFGIVCLLAAAGFELTWRRRLKCWYTTDGIVVAEVAGEESTSPEIEFQLDGVSKRFVSKHGGGRIDVGKTVRVLFDPETGEAEWLTTQNRWLGTVVCTLFGITFLYVGIAA